MESVLATRVPIPEFSKSLACALVCDENLAVPSAAIATLFAHFTDADVHVFVESSSGRDDPVKETTHDRVFYHYQRISGETYDCLPDHPRCTRATWGRIFVPEILRDYGRILYVDIDTIPSFLTSDITNFDLPDGLGLVRDAGFLESKFARAHIDSLPDDIARQMPSEYFNAGVMLIDPANWDTEMVHKRLSEFMEYGGHFSNLPDQDFLNFAFNGKITELSPNLNFQYPLMRFSLIESGTPSVRHFNSDLKPYHELPRYGASRIIRQASEELETLFGTFGISQAHIKPSRGIRKTRILKGAIRSMLQNAGVSSVKARRLTRQWRRHRQLALDYLDWGISEKKFADVFDLTVDHSKVDCHFDGFEVLGHDKHSSADISFSN